MLLLLGHFGNRSWAHSSQGTNWTAVIAVINDHVTDKGKKATHLATQPHEFSLSRTLSGTLRCTQVQDCLCSRCISRKKPSEQLQQFFVFMIRLLTYTPIRAPLSSSLFACTWRHITSSLCSSVTQASEHSHLSYFTISFFSLPAFLVFVYI